MASRNPTEETIFSFSRETPDNEARNDGARRLTTLRVGTIVIDGRRELCLIRNVSAGGLRVHAYSPLTLGQKVAVELKPDQPTEGSVSWVEEASAGIEFDSAIDVEELLASQSGMGDGWRARMPRIEVDRLGDLRVGARVYPVNSLDISQGGVRLEIDHPVKIGDNVVLTFEKFRPIQGAVRWYQHGQAGVAFNEVIPFRELMGWLRAE